MRAFIQIPSPSQGEVFFFFLESLCYCAAWEECFSCRKAVGADNIRSPSQHVDIADFQTTATPSKCGRIISAPYKRTPKNRKKPTKRNAHLKNKALNSFGSQKCTKMCYNQISFFKNRREERRLHHAEKNALLGSGHDADDGRLCRHGRERILFQYGAGRMV